MNQMNRRMFAGSIFTMAAALHAAESRAQADYAISARALEAAANEHAIQNIVLAVDTLRALLAISKDPREAASGLAHDKVYSEHRMNLLDPKQRAQTIALLGKQSGKSALREFNSTTGPFLVVASEKALSTAGIARGYPLRAQLVRRFRLFSALTAVRIGPRKHWWCDCYGLQRIDCKA